MEEQRITNPQEKSDKKYLSCQHRSIDHLNYKTNICNRNCYDIVAQRYNQNKYLVSSKESCAVCSDYLEVPTATNLLISIITLGTRNDLLQRTLSSLYYQINKELANIVCDVIVTVDGTNKIPDELFCSFKTIPSIYYINERVGICESLNRSLLSCISNYDYVMFCDDDIEFVASIGSYITLLLQRADIGCVSGYHDSRMAVTETQWFADMGKGLVKPITSGCHLVLRVDEVMKMMPFQGGHWYKDFPFIGFGYWVQLESEHSIKNIGKRVVVFPNRIRHTGEGQSTWEGKQEHELRERLGIR